MSLKENSDTSKVESPLDEKLDDETSSNFLNLGLGDIIKFIAPNNDIPQKM